LRLHQYQCRNYQVNAGDGMKQNLFLHLLNAAKDVYSSSSALKEFAPWPTDLSYEDKPVVLVPAVRQIKHWSDAHPLHKATQQVADYGNWKQSYTEDEVGFGFLQDYGYLELYGPDGHFKTDAGRAYLGYWGRGLYYPWHRHEAEEIYSVVSGSGYFESQGQEAALLGSGETRMHCSNQPHALTMTDGPILTFVLWRGIGMEGLPLMGAE